MLTTEQARQAWGPACQGARTRIVLFGGGTVSVRDEIVDAVHALDACLRAANYPTREADTGAYNCRRITGGTGYSLHAYGIALDLNWETNPYGAQLKTDMPPAMRAAIKAIRTRTGRQVWRWGGDYSGNKDAMHYEVVVTPADLATGIDPATVPDGQPSEEDDVLNQDDKKFLTDIQGAIHHDIVVAQGMIEQLQSLLTDSNSGILVQDHGVVSQKLRDLQTDVDAIKAKIGVEG